MKILIELRLFIRMELTLNEDRKRAVQRVESGRSRVSGQSIQKWTALSQYGRTFELTSTVQDDSERSSDPKWTVCRLKMDSPNESNDNNRRSLNDEVDCLEV